MDVGTGAEEGGGLGIGGEDVADGPAQDDTTVYAVAQPGHFVGHGAYIVSVAVRVQQLSVMHGCVMVERMMQAGRRHLAVLKVQEAPGAGASMRVLNVGQWRGARVVVVIVVLMTVW